MNVFDQGAYPSGVNSNDPHFDLPGGDTPEDEYEYQSRKARNLPPEPEHAAYCQCEECVCPY